MSVDVVVVGGGVAGASVAYHLAIRGAGSVTLVERGTPGAETTARSVGQFGRYGTEVEQRLKRYGRSLYSEFLCSPRTSVRYDAPGMLLVATEPANAERLRRAVETGDCDVGYLGTGLEEDAALYVPGSDLSETLFLPPVAVDRIEGALYRPGIGYLTPPQELAREFLERATEAGATVRSGTGVAAFETTGGRVTGVVTDDGTVVAADEVVCAAGPWTADLAASVGVDLPVRHVTGPVATFRPARPIAYDLPGIKHYESPYTVHRRAADEILVSYNEGTDYVDAAHCDPDAVDDAVAPHVSDGAREALGALVPDLPTLERVEEWVGVTSATPDGNPVVGRTKRPGFSVVAFHSSGIQLAPAVGDLVASALLEDDPSAVPESVSPSRFDAGVGSEPPR